MGALDTLFGGSTERARQKYAILLSVEPENAFDATEPCENSGIELLTIG